MNFAERVRFERNSSLTAGDYKPEVDGLRAMAIAMVLLYHLEVPGFQGGFVGVDVFFVISGYLITGLLWNRFEKTRSLDWAWFFRRRARRLLPAYVSAVGATFVAAALFLSPTLFSALSVSAIAALLSVSNILFWTQAGYFDLGAYSKPLLHTWTLGVEWQFYLAWPLILFALFRAGLKGSIAVVVIGAIGMASLAGNLIVAKYVGGDAARSMIFYLTPFRIFEFCFGAALAFAMLKPPRWLQEVGMIVGLAMIAVPCATYTGQIVFPAQNALLPCLGAVLTIACAAQSRTGYLLKNRVAVLIGKMSYSIYLVHWPVIVFWRYLGLTAHFSTLDDLAIVGVTSSLASVSYFWIERPFIERRAIGPVKLSPGAFLGLAVATTVCASLAALGGGWRWRSVAPPEMVALGTNEEFHKAYYGGSLYHGEAIFGNPTNVSIVLVGDSHARQYLDGLVPKYIDPSKEGIAVIQGPSCMHFPTLSLSVATSVAGCATDEHILHQMFLQYPNAVFVFAYRWTYLMQWEVVGQDETGRPATLADIHDAIVALSKLTRNRILIVAGVPETPFDQGIYDIATETHVTAAVRGTKSNFSWSAPNPKIAEFNSTLRQAASDAGFVYFDPWQYLCINGECRNFDDAGRPLYSDQNHLSIWGSEYVASALFSSIERTRVNLSGR